MDDYISREAAEQFICDVCERPGCPILWGGDCDRIDRLNKIPAADVVDVVRCIDCINWNGNDCITLYGINAPRPNDYCSRGERMKTMPSDLIYREDAKDFVRYAFHKGLDPVEYIDEVPAAYVWPCEQTTAISKMPGV